MILRFRLILYSRCMV